jgi:hypothetical protein
MSEIINIEIKADQSGADEAVQKVNKSLKEGKEAAEALNHVLDGDLAGSFKSLGELSKTLGVDLGLAFSPAEILAFVQLVAEVADKVTKLIADTFIYTDAMKAEDAALKAANKSLEDSAIRVKALDRATQLAATQGEIAKEKLRLAFTLEDLGGDPNALRAKLKKAEDEVARLSKVMNDTTHPKFGMHNEFGEMQDKINQLSNVTIPGLQAALNIADAEVKRTGQTIKNDLAGEAEKAAKKAEELHTMFVAMVYAERQAMQDKAAAHEKAEIQETIAVFAETDKQNQAIIKAADQQLAAWDEAYKGKIEAAKQASEIKIQQITQDFERGKINRQQGIAAIAQEKERELEIEKLTQQKRWALWDGDKKKQQEVQNQIDKIIAQSKLVQTKAVTDGLKAQEQHYRQAFQQIGNSLKTEILGMIQGTESVSQAFLKMYQSLISSLADYLAQKAEKKAEEWLIDKLFKQQENDTSISSAAAQAYAYGFADSASLGPEGLAAAPGVASGAAAAVSGGAQAIAKLAIGTNYVPMDGLAFLHKGEKVIPAGTTGPGYSGDSTAITVVVNHSVSAVDAASFQGHIRRHSNMIANEVTRALKRKGAR